MLTQKVIVIGGGLAGLVNALRLSGQGVEVTLVEKKRFPFHKVCGEYISNEVLPFLKTLGVAVEELKPAQLTHFMLSSPAGRTLQTPLDLGGFGISRYRLDHHLYQLAQRQGVTFREQVSTTDVYFDGNIFIVTLSSGEQLQAPVVIGAYGKRSALDRRFNRAFFEKRSPYLAVKYHVRTQLPRHIIALHNFSDGYAGVSAIEEDRFCFCYLTTRQNLKKHGTIAEMEAQELYKNPHLRDLFANSEFLYPQPEVINEISFEPKACLEDHVLMSGDAAGLITPLCGNGMAMAIHSAKLLSEQVLLFLNGQQTRSQMEANYASDWQRQFGARLQTGRLVQRLFGQPVLSELAVAGLKYLPGAVNAIMRRTHGKPF
ncbi:NAD(P)/FAD-dependent oxidoreductase [Rufibacter latericius]|uniref:NAD(P)/FAD-dependent oxidoreductase n=1 Tax=Rufibacter latericius TaxID=2487040 RepID=A0A3M9MKH5_9BACT|nr:NAD(P)/FAD-dependent oxidoreductase [Rufibacter latericius]RNI25981.1 NAD(P)/FAD-dependent oxidoreductase [Rufibacter latericius]